LLVGTVLVLELAILLNEFDGEIVLFQDGMPQGPTRQRTAFLLLLPPPLLVRECVL
jgi:hypothetical protein